MYLLCFTNNTWYRVIKKKNNTWYSCFCGEKKMKMKIDKISIKIDYVIKRLIGLVIMLLITK
jgi:hypothetical protein